MSKDTVLFVTLTLACQASYTTATAAGLDCMPALGRLAADLASYCSTTTCLRYSKHQKCKGTSHMYKEELSTFHIATASGEAELRAAADAVKASQPIRYVGQELKINMGRIIVM